MGSGSWPEPPDGELSSSGAVAPAEGSTRNLPLIEFLACVIEGKQALYVSTAITTGVRYLRWLRAHSGVPQSDQATLQKDVIEPNLRHGHELVGRVRDRFPGIVVIDPTAVHLQGWEQEEYHELWGLVIHRYARTVVFGDGWEYSHGCAYEFVTCYKGRVQCLDERWQPISIADGLHLMRKAVADYRAVGVIPHLLIRAVEDVAQMPASETQQ